MTSSLSGGARSDLESFAAAFNAGPMMTFLGFRMTFAMESERVLVDLPVIRPEHRGGLGTGAVNGGILSAMFDFALGSTALFLRPMRRSATVQLSMNFERPVHGSSARCEAWLDRAAASLVFASGTISDANGTICSRATALVSLGKEQSLEERIRAFTGPHLESASALAGDKT